MSMHAPAYTGATQCRHEHDISPCLPSSAGQHCARLPRRNGRALARLTRVTCAETCLAASTTGKAGMRPSAVCSTASVPTTTHTAGARHCDLGRLVYLSVALESVRRGWKQQQQERKGLP